MRKLLPLLALFVFAVFFAGCISEMDISPGTKEMLDRASAKDTDHDQDTDWKSYQFKPVVVHAGANISFQRYASVYVNSKSVGIVSHKAVNSTVASDFEGTVMTFDYDRKAHEYDCDKTLGGYVGRQCGTYAECSAACVSQKCQIFTSSSDLMGYWIKRYWADRTALDNEMEKLKAAGLVLSGDKDADKDAAMRSASRVMDISAAISTNPIFDINEFGLCAPFDYNTGLLQDAVSSIGEMRRTPQNYSYIMFVRIISSGSEYSEINVSDSIPGTISGTMSGVSVPQYGGGYDAQSTEVYWGALKSPGAGEFIIGYDFASPVGMREDILEGWDTMHASVQVVSIGSSPVIMQFIAASNVIYMAFRGLGHYAALGAVAGIWAILITLLMIVFSAIISIIAALVSKSDLVDAARKSMGMSNAYWKEYIVAMVIFLALGAVLSSGAPAQTRYDRLTLESLQQSITMYPVGAAGSVCIFLGIYLFYSALEDYSKFRISGGQKRGAPENSASANKIRMAYLKDKIAEFKGISAKAKSAEVDISEESRMVAMVPAEKINALFSTPGSERAARQLLEVSIANVEMSISSLSKKLDVFSEHGKDWNKYISEMFSGKDEVAYSELVEIPDEWRKPAIEEYVKTSGETGITFDGIKLRRTNYAAPEKKATDRLRAALSHEGSISVGVLSGEEKECLSRHSGASVDAALATKIMDYGRSLGEKVFSAAPERIIVRGRKAEAIFSISGAGRCYAVAKAGMAEALLQQVEKLLK
jgi:hypothetical protein